MFVKLLYNLPNDFRSVLRSGLDTFDCERVEDLSFLEQ